MRSNIKKIYTDYKVSNKLCDFAFLVHPRDIQDIYKKYPYTKIIPSKLLKVIFRNIPPLILTKINGAIDANGVKRRGVVITLPITAEQMLDDRNASKKQVIRALKKAKNLGASYVGLGSFTSVVTSGGADIVGLFKDVHLTNGNALTAHMTFLGIQNIIKKTANTRLNIAIIGATGSIGSAVTELLTQNGTFGTMYIVGRTQSRIVSLLQKILHHQHSHRVIQATIEEALPNADIILLATSAKGSVIGIDLLKKGVIIYDITQPKNIPTDILQKRPDVTIIDGGLVRLPNNISIPYDFGLEKGVIFSCLAETILLSLSQYPDDFCVGNVTLDKVLYAEKLAKQYHFTPLE